MAEKPPLAPAQFAGVQISQREKGLRMVFTGQWKGKTTTGPGLVLRILGHGEQVAVVQFIKGAWIPGEAKLWRCLGSNCGGMPWGKGLT